MNRTTLRALTAAALLVAPLASQAATGDPVLEAPAMRWPTPATRTLPNGLQVAVFSRHTLPIVQIQLTLAAGSAEEGPLPPGTAAMLAALVRAGTSSRTADQFQRDLELLGGSMSSNVTRDNAVVAAAFLSEQLGPGLELLSDAVLSPILPADEVENARRVAITTLAPVRGAAPGLAEEYAWRAAFAPHPYERPTHGGSAGLLAVSRDDLRAMHRDHWRPDRACLVIAGDVEPERAFALADEWFGRWSGSAASDRDWPTPRPAFARIQLVDVPGAEAEIRLVRPAPARGSPDLVDWTLATTALQEPLRLPANVRATLTPQREASLLTIATRAPVDSVAARIRAIQASFQRLANRPPGEDDMGRARVAYAQSLPQSIETLGGLAAQWSVGRLAGLGDDHLQRLASVLGAPRAPSGPASVWPLLDKPWVMVVAGPAARLEPALQALGQVDRVSTHERPPLAATAPPTPAERARGRQRVDAAIAAHGGLTKLKGVKAIATEGDIEISTPVGNVLGRFSAMRARPDRFFMATNVLETSMQQVLIGDRGWTSAPAGDSLIVRDLDSSGVAVARSLMENDVVTMLLAARAAEPFARGTDRIHLKPVEAVEYTTTHGQRQRLLFDVETHRLSAMEFAPTPAGVWQEQRQFVDYRLSDGVWLPYSEERWVSGQQIGVTTNRRIMVNPPVDENLFQYPRR